MNFRRGLAFLSLGVTFLAVDLTGRPTFYAVAAPFAVLGTCSCCGAVDRRNEVTPASPIQ